MAKVVFAAGVAVGYVLGARAGRERYDELTRRARRLAESPVAQEVGGVLAARLGAVLGVQPQRRPGRGGLRSVPPRAA